MVLVAILAGACVNVDSPDRVDVRWPAFGSARSDDDPRYGEYDRGGDGRYDRDADTAYERRGGLALDDHQPRDFPAGLDRAIDGGMQSRRNARPSDRRASSNRNMVSTAATIAGAIIGQGQAGHLLFGLDVLTLPGKPVRLRVRLRSYDPEQQNLAGVEIAFRRDLDRKLIGVAVTDDDGRAEIDGPGARPGQSRFTADVIATPPGLAALRDLPPAAINVFAARADTPFVVVDLDRTLVDSSFFRVMLLDGGRPMRNSIPVLRRIAKQYAVIYLTQRPGELTRLSRQWLIRQGYPAGPILLSRLRELAGDSGRSKSARLVAVRKSFPRLEWGIGDKVQDIRAYQENGLRAIWIPHLGDDRKDLWKLVDEIRAARLGEKVIVVTGWRQIERAIFDDYRCSPSRFADRLEDRARRYPYDD